MESTKKTEAFLGRLEAALQRIDRAVGAVSNSEDWRTCSDCRPQIAADPEQAPRAARRYAVAFSGGLDSTVLLAALCRLPARPPLRALHVNHGLAADAARWARRTADVAAACGIAYAAREVHVDRRGGTGIEAAARQARYAALAAMIEPGEVLLTAHQADDQLETVLLRLLRGAGAEGLAATRALAPFGSGFLARPLLDFPREALRREAERWGLDWLEDPSNADTRHDRNFLRRRIVPALRERWPGAPGSAVRLADRMQDAEEVLAAMAEHDRGADAAPGRIGVARLRALSPARQRNLLRYLIRQAGLAIPTAAQLEQLRAALELRRPDARTRVAWPGGEARIYRGQLYLLAPLAAQDAGAAAAAIALGRPWAGPAGRIDFAPSPGPGLPATWLREGLRLTFRHGGERLKPLGSAHSRPLKKWLQDAGIVPWMRARIPLLYRRDELVAVGDLWLADAVARAADAERWRVIWTDHPPLR